MQRVWFIKEVETANEYWTWKKTCYGEGEDDRVHLAKKERWKARSVDIIRVLMKSENLIDCVERVYMVDTSSEPTEKVFERMHMWITKTYRSIPARCVFIFCKDAKSNLLFISQNNRSNFQIWLLQERWTNTRLSAARLLPRSTQTLKLTVWYSSLQTQLSLSPSSGTTCTSSVRWRRPLERSSTVYKL